MKKKLLITGFDPFGGEQVNPAFEAVRLLPVLESLSDWAEAEMGSGEGELPE